MFTGGLWVLIAGAVTALLGFLGVKASEKTASKPAEGEDLSFLSGCFGWIFSLGVLLSGGALGVVGAILMLIGKFLGK